MKHTPLDTVGMAVNGLSIALYFYLASILQAPAAPLPLRYLAWVLSGLGLVLVLLSVVTLMANRGAGLIDRGIYGVVRHPMYLGAMLLFLSWVLFLPHWIVLLLSSANAAIVYGFILQGERKNITRFGDSYRRYMQRVPRVNLLAGMARTWWLYPLLLLLFFTPTYASRSYDPRQSMDLIGQVLSSPLIYAFPVLMPIAKIVTAVLIVGVLVYGNKMRRGFNVYVAILYLALAFFQTAAVTDTYGLVVISGNTALVLVVALAWVWEVVVERNDFGTRKRPWWRWWVAPLAILSFLGPVDASTMSPDFSPVRLLTNEAGLTFCMMTPVVLAVLTLFYPTVNPVVLRVSSFAGVLLGAVNMIVWFVLESWGWWMGVLHIPLVVISIYAFVLAHLRTAGESPGTIPVLPQT